MFISVLHLFNIQHMSEILQIWFQATAIKSVTIFLMVENLAFNLFKKQNKTRNIYEAQ